MVALLRTLLDRRDVLAGQSVWGGAVIRALQVAHAGFEFVDDFQVVVVAEHMRVRLIEIALQAGWSQIAEAQAADADTGKVQGQGDGEKGHGGRHGQSRLQERLADSAKAEAGCDAAGERQNITRAIGCRRAEGGGGLAYRMAEKGAGLPGGV